VTSWRWFWLWVVLAALVRLTIALALPQTIDRAEAAGIAFDGQYAYLPQATSLLRGEGLAVDGQPLATHVPGYPILLAAALGITPSVRAAVLLLQISCGALVVGGVFGLGVVLFGALPAHIAALLALLFPDFIAYSLLNLSESPHLLAMLIASFAMLGLLRASQPWRAVAVGAALGTALLIRESTLPILGVWVLSLLQTRFGDPVHRKRIPAIVVAIAVAFLLPWWVRNWVVFGEFVPLTSKGMSSFYQATLIRPYPVSDHRNKSGPPDLEDVALRERASQAPTLARQNLIFLEAALENIRRDPAGQLVHVGRKLGWFWSPNIGPRHGERLGAPLLFWGAGALHFALLGLGLVGLWNARKRWDVAVVLTFPLLASTAFHLVVASAEPRYHFPLWPALLLGAGAVLAPWLERARAQLRATSGPS
jgi:4-amino-4-deoxy-L-arabinose transferase-like glycosyltransferase